VWRCCRDALAGRRGAPVEFGAESAAQYGLEIGAEESGGFHGGLVRFCSPIRIVRRSQAEVKQEVGGNGPYHAIKVEVTRYMGA